MKKLHDYPEIMTAKDVANYLHMSYAKALYLLKYGDLPCIRIGQIFKVSRAVFGEWVNEPGKKVIS